MSDTNAAGQKVSVIGLGAMGAGIARTYVEAGCDVSSGSASLSFENSVCMMFG